MNLYIDTEFNSYMGELISIALVAEDGREFYEVLKCENPDPWVAEHVMPVLQRPPVANQRELSYLLESFLSDFDSVNIVADWPDDLMWFCRLLVTGPGARIDTPPLTMEIDRRLTSENSLVPHNALHDARAIRESYVYLRLPQGMRSD